MLVLAACVGCGGTSGPLPEGATGTVAGKVSYQGQAIPSGAVIVFAGDKSGLIGTGIVDSSSNYKLVMRDGSQVLCGNYRVTIVPPAPTTKMSDEEAMRLSAEGKMPKLEEFKQIPEAYRSPETTTLQLEVKPGDNKLDIELKD